MYIIFMSVKCVQAFIEFQAACKAFIQTFGVNKTVLSNTTPPPPQKRPIPEIMSYNLIIH
jgi:hypothetical protein